MAFVDVINEQFHSIKMHGINNVFLGVYRSKENVDMLYVHS
jgi:hypothetical protein